MARGGFLHKSHRQVIDASRLDAHNYTSTMHWGVANGRRERLESGRVKEERKDHTNLIREFYLVLFIYLFILSRSAIWLCRPKIIGNAKKNSKMQNPNKYHR
jgi:hypothetical protein